MPYTRRDFGKLALAAVPAASALAAVNSKFGGVQIGAISYCFRATNSLDDVLKMMVDIGLGECELMSNHAENGAGAPSVAFPGGRGGGGAPAAGVQARAAGVAPPAGGEAQKGAGRQGRGGRQLTPEQQAEMRAAQENLRNWRKTVSMDKFKEVKSKFDAAGIQLALLCYNMQDSMTDDEIEYGFNMAKALGVRGMTTSTTLTMAKRIAPLADKHKMTVGYHGHDQTSDPNQFATLESYATAFSYGKYNAVNLDIGHFTASNYDAVAFIKEHHDRITNLHLKDRKKDHGPNTLWGEGDTPLKDVLLLMKKEKYKFPGNIELEYQIPEGSTVPAEMKKCLQYCKETLA